ncbi:serine/threonine-protein kinase [Actinomadura kijaniata]|uniref:serine/threonine-protein kinase n=1 Tax=Actinomadura kijaniata TaxID=46161 RepID=UPI000A029192|nr:serine/threonine-protein kinase [Actinomadura kijaniata]
MPQVIAGRYELVEALGRGGMGAVWRARDRTLAREVAVKEVVLPTGLSPEQVERVYARTFREARAAARLDHPGIVTVHDVVEEDGRPWIVMRLVRAPALDKVIQREGPLPPARVAAIGLDLLAALRAAHAAGIVHRDVKPGNVLLPPQGAVLTDFGIATATGDETLTATGAIVGSPAYLAPEQARHQKATPASDLWSLGATLYAAVEGRSPFQRGDVWGVMAALLSDDPDPMRNAGPLRPVLEGLLRKDPARRLHPDEAGHLLRQVAATPATPAWSSPMGTGLPSGRDTTLPPLSPPPTEGVPTPSRPNRWPLLVPAGVLALAVVIAVVTVLAFTADEPGPRGTPPTGQGTGPSSASTDKAPDGYQTYRGSHFVAHIPKGWTAESGRDNDVTFKDPSKESTRGIVVQRVLPGSTDNSVQLRNLSESFKKDSTEWPDYDEQQFRTLSYQEGRAAEMEFTFTKSGKPGRAQLRIFTYQGATWMAILAAKRDSWPSTKPLFEEFLRSFRQP